MWAPIHSNRSGGAMGMFLTGTPVYTIMLLGCWSSNAFMRYIRKQVLKMSHGVSSKMITFKEFYTVPDFVHNTVDGDLRTRNRNNLASTTSFRGSDTDMRQGLHPAFHLEHWILSRTVSSSFSGGYIKCSRENILFLENKIISFLPLNLLSCSL